MTAGGNRLSEPRKEVLMLDELTLASGMKIWCARPDSAAKCAAIVILHGRRGPIDIDGSWDRVERLARDGFVTCVPDLYHRFTGDRGPIEAQKDRIDFSDDEYLADVDETIAYLRSLPNVDGDHIGVAGFCMSGRISLTFAAARDAKAVVMFHGGLYPRLCGRFRRARVGCQFRAEIDLSCAWTLRRTRPAGASGKYPTLQERDGAKWEKLPDTCLS